MSGLGHEITKVCRKGYIGIASSSHELYDTLIWIIKIFLSNSLSHKQCSYLNAFSFSWTDGLCVFNYTFSKKRSQSSHLKCFVISWIPYRYVCVLSSQASLCWETCPANIVLMWLLSFMTGFNATFCENVATQSSHSNDFFFSLWFFDCLFW